MYSVVAKHRVSRLLRTFVKLPIVSVNIFMIYM